MNKIEFNNLVEEDIEEVDLLEKVLLYAMDKEGLVDTSFDVIFVVLFELLHSLPVSFNILRH